VYNGDDDDYDDDGLCLAASPRTILVSDVTNFDRDQLELYFENRGRSGGGSVQQVVMHGTQAVVTFVDPQGIYTLAIHFCLSQ